MSTIVQDLRSAWLRIPDCR